MTHEQAIKAGHAVVASSQWLDEHLDADWMPSLRTAHNKRRCGVLDEWVAYLDTLPPDLEFHGMEAWASGKYLSEINAQTPR